MNVKAILFSAILMLSLLLGSNASKAGDCFDGGACTMDELLGGDDINYGGLLFNNFHGYSAVSNPPPNVNAYNPANIIVTTLTSNGEAGLLFQFVPLLSTQGGVSLDIAFQFTVTCTGGFACLTDNTLEFSGAHDGNGSAQIIEAVDLPGSDLDVSKLVYSSPNGARVSHHKDFPGGPYMFVDIRKDIALTTFASGDWASISDLTQTFSMTGGNSTDGGNSTGQQVPEPSTMLLLGTGLLGVAAWGRRRLRKDA